MLAIHPQARTTPAVRAEIARSSESSGVLVGADQNPTIFSIMRAIPMR